MQVDTDHEIITVQGYSEHQVYEIEVVYITIIFDDEYLGHMKQCSDHVQSDIMYQVVENGLDCRLCCDCDILVIIVRQLIV